MNRSHALISFCLSVGGLGWALVYLSAPAVPPALLLLFVILDRAPATLIPRQSLTDARFLVPPRVSDEPGVLGIDAEGPLADAGVVTTDSQGVARKAVPSGPRGDLYPANEQASHANEHGGIVVQVVEREPGAKQPPRAKQMRLRGSLGDSETRRSLFVREPLDVVQDEHGATP